MFESWDDVKEFSWIFAQLTVVCLILMGVFAVGAFIVITLFNAVFPSSPSHPPAMNAPLLHIVRYCEPLARDKHTSFNGKTTSVSYTDNPEKFIACMQDYEYQIKR